MAAGTCLLLLAVGWFAGSAAEQCAFSSLLQLAAKKAPRRAPAGGRRPNLLYVVLDQWRWDWAGFHSESGVAMPRLAALAAGGLRFDRAYAPAPLCMPSRCAFAAGRSAYSTWVKDNGQHFFPAEGPTYMQLLQKAGYRTMSAGKDHLSTGQGVGIDGSASAQDLGFDAHRRTNDKYDVFSLARPTEPYGAYLDSLGLYAAQRDCYGTLGRGACCNGTAEVCQSTAGPLMLELGMQECGFLCQGSSPADEEHDIDTWTAIGAETLLQEHATGEHAGKPWYMSVSFPGPHPPFIMSPSMTGALQGAQLAEAKDAAGLSATAVRESRRAYAALLGRIDGLIGRLVDFLDASHQLNDTLIMVTSDHGEHLGDHGHFAKSSAWDVSTRVPLVVAGPGVLQGRVVTSPVETLDLVGTMLEFAGTQPGDGMETVSLKAFLTGQSSELPRETVRIGLDSVGEGSNFNAAVHQYNASTTLKLVCCPRSEHCIKGGSLLPTGVPGEPQAALTRVGADSPGDLENLLREGAGGRGCEEARGLLPSIAAAYQPSCAAAIDRFCAK